MNGGPGYVNRLIIDVNILFLCCSPLSLYIPPGEGISVRSLYISKELPCTEAVTTTQYSAVTTKGFQDVQQSSGSIRRIFHGTLDANLRPVYGGGKDYHDYGNGLYCTEDMESAKEWACQHEGISTAYVYTYDLNMVGLSPLLDLNKKEPIYWLSALAQNRYGRNEPRLRRARRLSFIQMFPMNCEQFEVIDGWRANDRYFVYLKYFLNSDISYEAVVQAIKLGNLGQQVVIKGKKAFEQCTQVGNILTVSGEDYAKYNKHYIEREQMAGEKLQEVRDIQGMVLSEIMARGGI